MGGITFRTAYVNFADNVTKVRYFTNLSEKCGGGRGITMLDNNGDGKPDTASSCGKPVELTKEDKDMFVNVMAGIESALAEFKDGKAKCSKFMYGPESKLAVSCKTKREESSIILVDNDNNGTPDIIAELIFNPKRNFEVMVQDKSIPKWFEAAAEQYFKQTLE